MPACRVHDKARLEYSEDGLFESLRRTARQARGRERNRVAGPRVDWLLVADIEAPDAGHTIGRLVGLFRGPDPVKEIQATVPHDVVITQAPTATERATIRTETAVMASPL